MLAAKKSEGSYIFVFLCKERWIVLFYWILLIKPYFVSRQSTWPICLHWSFHTRNVLDQQRLANPSFWNCVYSTIPSLCRYIYFGNVLDFGQNWPLWPWRRTQHNCQSKRYFFKFLSGLLSTVAMGALAPAIFWHSINVRRVSAPALTPALDIFY